MEPTESNQINRPVFEPKEPMFSKKIVVIILVMLLAVIAVVAITKNNKSATKSKTSSALVEQPALVEVTNKGFEPQTISVKVGQNVQWTNKDTAQHQVASDPHPSDDALPGLKDDAAMEPSDSFSYTFNKKGTYTYHDELNPLQFKGTITVE